MYLIHMHKLETETLCPFWGQKSIWGHWGQILISLKMHYISSYPAGAAAGYCFLLISSLHRRMQCACVLFLLNSSTSFCATKCLNQFWWNLVTMTNDQARRCPMTFDPVKGHSRSKGSKINIFSKTHQVHQVSWYVHNTHTHDSLQCPLQKLWD